VGGGGTTDGVYDLAVIGGGINGCGVARDAAGRGWSVFLCDKGDLAGATSSAATKLIHGGLRYLEYYEFRLVREALLERETLWRIAPHIIWPLRFVLPYNKGMRPAWLLRLGLFLYDHIGGRKLLPPTRTLRLRTNAAGAPLKSKFTLGFEYSDCWVQDSRLVVLNARDAANRGAVIAPRTRCVGGVRRDGVWVLSLKDEVTGESRQIRARAVVNASGPWVNDTHEALNARAPVSVRLVKGSHIVVPRLYDHDRCYFFQNADRRIFFVIPYEQEFTLIGTTDLDYVGDPVEVRASDDEISYLCKSASEYFQKPIDKDRVHWSYSGVRPLFDDGASEAQAATRDYVLNLDAPDGAPALLSVYGGKITTYRRLAESALAMLSPHLPKPTGSASGWTGGAPLPGGDFEALGFEDQVRVTSRRYPFLNPAYARRLTRAYGTLVSEVLGEAKSLEDLGENFGADLTEAEVRYLARREWATTAADIIWRRGKFGLRLAPGQIAHLDEFMKQTTGQLQRVT
jgi:glycerol-3-phosphate dehydrogenase